MPDRFTLNVHEQYAKFKTEKMRLEKEYEKLKFSSDPTFLRRMINRIKYRKVLEKIKLIEENLHAHL